MTKAVGRRRFLGLVTVPVVAVLVAAVGCASAPRVGQPGQPNPDSGATAVAPPRSEFPPGGCAQTLRDPAGVQRALDAAVPGAQICVSGTGLASAELTVHRSGAPGKPIQLLSDGATLRAITVTANQVVVAGFVLRGGDGLSLEGAGLTAHDNVVQGASRDGIGCECTDALIESNTVDRSDGSGIVVQGKRITVRGNTVSGSVRKEASDADGMRFFGDSIQITGNTIRDISEKGYPEGEAPHTDCFQTYDSGSPPTYNVVIAGNRCERVDVQCLIATAENGNPGTPPGARSIVFRDNICDIGGAQAVNLDGYPHVDVIGNTISGSHMYRGVYLSNGAKDVSVVDNTVLGPQEVFEADEDSEPVRNANNQNRP
ncbi:MAG TPA: right-handed parallel beta-helix repeat-containing protein [Pseudonocardia sp.]|nr:right-handed parallel beta-helix repeat-containing protein [Pseudonocardia sp.]